MTSLSLVEVVPAPIVKSILEYNVNIYFVDPIQLDVLRTCTVFYEQGWNILASCSHGAISRMIYHAITNRLQRMFLRVTAIQTTLDDQLIYPIYRHMYGLPAKVTSTLKCQVPEMLSCIMKAEPSKDANCSIIQNLRYMIYETVGIALVENNKDLLQLICQDVEKWEWRAFHYVEIPKHLCRFYTALITFLNQEEQLDMITLPSFLWLEERVTKMVPNALPYAFEAIDAKQLREKFMRTGCWQVIDYIHRQYPADLQSLAQYLGDAIMRIDPDTMNYLMSIPGVVAAATLPINYLTEVLTAYCNRRDIKLWQERLIRMLYLILDNQELMSHGIDRKIIKNICRIREPVVTLDLFKRFCADPRVLRDGVYLIDTQSTCEIAILNGNCGIIDYMVEKQTLQSPIRSSLEFSFYSDASTILWKVCKTCLQDENAVGLIFRYSLTNR